MKERREGIARIYFGVVCAGVGAAAIAGLIRFGLDYRAWRERLNEPRPPWERT